MRLKGKQLLEQAILLQVDGKGKQKVALEGYPAQLQGYALLNTKGKSITYIAFKSDRRVFVTYEGSEREIPKVTYFPEPSETDIYIEESGSELVKGF